MKRKSLYCLLAIVIAVTTAFRLSDSVIGRLGMEEQYAQRAILNNIIGRQNHEPIDVSKVEDGVAAGSVGSQLREFVIPRARLLASVISQDKTGAARELCSYVKGYVTSDKFLDDYRKARESAVPAEEPYVMDAAAMEELKKGLKEQEVTLAKAKASKQVPASMLKQWEDAIAEQKKMIAGNSDPTPNKTKWQKMYPENPMSLVKARLEEYLKLAGTVDYAAQLTADRNKKKFVNPAYEKQSLKWKAVFRAGKEVNQEVAVFVKSWVKEPAMSIIK